MELRAEATRIWKSARARVERPSDGALFTTNPVAASGGGASTTPGCERVNSSCCKISPEASSQFSANAVCRPFTSGPSTRIMVSRHGRPRRGGPTQ